MARSVALEINGFTNIFEQTSPDFVLLLGDRGEMLAAAIACLLFAFYLIVMLVAKLSEKCTRNI
ncbi:hypothetical protein EfmAA55_08790 [Enterococcus faecium]|nr:hypothetical protein EfmAA55_08790 [Enterococcus faecium]